MTRFKLICTRGGAATTTTRSSQQHIQQQSSSKHARLASLVLLFFFATMAFYLPLFDIAQGLAMPSDSRNHRTMKQKMLCGRRTIDLGLN